MKDIQARVEEEQHLASDYREQYGIAERHAHALNGELEESRTLLEQSDRGRRQAEGELADANENLNCMTTTFNNLGLAKRKLEGELQTLHVSNEWRIIISLSWYQFFNYWKKILKNVSCLTI